MYFPKGLISPDENFGLCYARIIYDDVGPASKMRAKLFEGCFYRFTFAYIASERQGINTEFFNDVFRDRFSGFGRSRGDGQRTSFTRQSNRNRAADATTAAGDKCQAICEPHKNWSAVAESRLIGT